MQTRALHKRQGCKLAARPASILEKIQWHCEVCHPSAVNEWMKWRPFLVNSLLYWTWQGRLIIGLSHFFSPEWLICLLISDLGGVQMIWRKMHAQAFGCRNPMGAERLTSSQKHCIQLNQILLQISVHMPLQKQAIGQRVCCSHNINSA